MRKKTAAFLALFFISLLLFQLLPFTGSTKVSAKNIDGGSEVKEFCKPPVTQYGSDKNVQQPKDWLKARFIDRAHIELTYDSGGKCDKLVNDVALGGLIAGKDKAHIYADVAYGLLGKDYRYDIPNGQINNFGGDCSSRTNDGLGSRDRNLSVADIRKYCLENGNRGAELKIAIKETDIGGYNCVENSDGTFIYSDPDGGNPGFIWTCQDTGYTGHGLVIAHDFTDADLLGFNITYNIIKDSSGQSVIQHVSQIERDKRTFQKCDNGYNNAQNCSGDLDLLDKDGKVLGYGSLDNINSPTVIRIAKRSDHKSYSDVVVGPPDGDSAKISGSTDGFTGSTADAAHPTCESVGGPLSWVLCAIFNGLASFADWMLDNVVQPLLHVAPISTNPTNSDGTPNGTFQVWSTFRIYGNILLIIALLALVIAQSVGGGLIDAYTAKKMVPRILIAAILINLSIYIVAAAVDITNVIGGGIGGLMIGPFKSNALFTFTPNGIQRAGTVVAAGATGVGAIGTFLTGLLFTETAIHAAAFIGLFVLLPAVLAIAGAFITIVLRQGLLLFLILVSPVAFALYCLPNTEQYFKKWWDLFFKTLLVYPIIIAIFAIADIMTVAIMQANKIGNGPLLVSVPNNLLAGLVAFVVQFLPLALIPFAFKFAGGAIASVHGFLSNNGKRIGEAIKGNPNNPNSLRNRVKSDLRESLTRGQGQIVDRGRKGTIDAAGVYHPATRFQRARYGLARRTWSGVDERLSEYNTARAELEEKMSARGRDGLRYAGAGWVLQAGRATEDGLTGLDNKPIAAGNVATHDRFFDSKGREVEEPYYREGKQRHGNNISKVSQNLEYTYRKAQTDQDVANARRALRENAVANNYTQQEVGDVWAAATFPHKDKWLSEWFSAPKVITDPATGRTTGIDFRDVSRDDESYKKFVGEAHRTKEAFRLSSLRDQDYRAMYAKQQELEDKAANGVATADDLVALGQTYEVFDAVSQKMRVGSVDPEHPEISAGGASPAAQAIIQGAVSNRRGKLDTLDNQGERMLSMQAAGPPAPVAGPGGAPAPGTAPTYVQIGRVRLAGELDRPEITSV